MALGAHRGSPIKGWGLRGLRRGVILGPLLRREKNSCRPYARTSPKQGPFLVFHMEQPHRRRHRLYHRILRRRRSSVSSVSLSHHFGVNYLTPFLFLVTFSKKRKEKMARLISKESSISETKSPFRPSTPYPSQYTGNARQTFALQLNIVPLLKNAAGLSTREVSPSRVPKCLCCKKDN